MKDEIRDIFLELKFKEHKSLGSSFFIGDDKNKKTFWFVTDTDLMNILENQGEFYEQCKAITTDKSLKKNCNLLLIHKIQDKLTEKNRRTLLKIEENPYHFRKYVLYYTESELNELKNLQGEESLLNYIVNNAFDTEIFEQFKNKVEEYSGLALMYRILIKMPFIKIESNPINGLKNLEKVIEESVDSINATIFHDRLLNNFEDYSVEDINNMEPDEVFSIVEMGETEDEHQN